VFKYNCDNRHIKGKFVPSPCFVVDNDFRIGEAWLEETLPRTGDVVEELSDSEPTDMYLRFWIKTGYDEPKKMNLRCTFNGKVITKDGLNREQTRIAYKEFPKDNGPQHDVTWRKWWFAMPDIAGRPAKTGTEKRPFYISENAGDYRCVVTSDGDEVAEVQFTVAAGGKIDHKCVDDTRVDAITASDRRHLVKVKFKSGFNVKHDASAFKTEAFYGKQLSTGCPP